MNDTQNAGELSLARTIGFSEIQAMQECPQRHYFQYIRDLQPNKPQLWSLLGTAVHAALAAYHGRGEECLPAYDASFRALLEEVVTRYIPNEEEYRKLRELFALGQSMLTHYLDHYQALPSFQMLVSELAFVVPIPGTDGGSEGRIDGIIVDRYGLYWIIEHKTSSNFPDPAYYALDTQSLKYHWAVQQLITAGSIPEVPADAVLTGWCYNGLLKAEPKRPELVEKGKRLSKAKIATTRKVYLETILDYGFNPEDYQDMLAKLPDENENPFFRRAWYPRTPYELRMIAWRLQMEYQERWRSDRPILPVVTKMCPKCAYYEPCLLTQRGGDVEDYLSREFHAKEHSSTTRERGER